MSLQMAGEAARNQLGQCGDSTSSGNPWKFKRRGSEVSLFPCSLYTISCSLGAGAGREALRNGGKQGGSRGLPPSRAAAQKGSDSPKGAGASGAPVTAPRGGLGTEHRAQSRQQRALARPRSFFERHRVTHWAWKGPLEILGPAQAGSPGAGDNSGCHRSAHPTHKNQLQAALQRCPVLPEMPVHAVMAR